MAARAIWKGIITFGPISVPVKFYSAVEDRKIHFRMLHDKDHVPVSQQMVHPAPVNRSPGKRSNAGIRTRKKE
jgi:DNA end-binding protein Ku